ncbi:unnamed protein product [Amaranthus hypochondriacus]
MNGGDDTPLSSQFYLQPPQQPSNNGGEFLLRLVQNRNQHQQPYLPHNIVNPSHTLPSDPAVAAVGPTIPLSFSSNHQHQHQNQHHFHSPPFSVAPQNQNPNFSFQGFPRQNVSSSHTASFYPAPRHQYEHLRRQPQQQQQQQQIQGLIAGNSSSFSNNPVEEESLRLKELQLGLSNERDMGFGLPGRRINGMDPNHRIDPRGNWFSGSGEQRRSGQPSGFSSKKGNQRWDFDNFNNVGGEKSNSSELRRNNNSKSYEKERRFLGRDNGNGLSKQLDRPGVPSGSSLHSIRASDVEQSLKNSQNGLVDEEVEQNHIKDLSEQLVDSVLGENQSEDKNLVGAKKKNFRDKDFRSDARGKWILSQKMRNSRRLIECRRDIDRLDAHFTKIYESLIPVEEEKAKQKQLLTLLETLVCKEWPGAKLYLYGSCANSFGVLKSDIDLCLAIDDQDIDKSEILLKLADILQEGNFHDVQALTRARVPIVKLKDPGTGISCDICINNVLAVVNTKLLRDYAEIDVRLRQLAFLVKHWAKSRGVNETYQGTLSSYSYVLMCIHFLQQRSPPILPCLQSMKVTYSMTVDNIECTFFDEVEKLRDFGFQNKEKISKLLWGFFNYWAYCHDYANQVISVRTGCLLSKQEKDWTRRVGNDRHLICIEDPFETSHDLGRVVDKYSIRVLREEFERAANIMQYDPNPWVALFQPYIPS